MNDREVYTCSSKLSSLPMHKLLQEGKNSTFKMCLILIMRDYLLATYQLRQQRKKYEEKKMHKSVTKVEKIIP